MNDEHAAMRRLDGAPDPSSYDDAVASLCQSKGTSKNLDGPVVPTLIQTAASAVTVTFPPPVAGYAYGATYLTDEDGTIVPCLPRLSKVTLACTR